MSFEEAKTVFYNDESIVFDDPDNSEDEDRFLIFGYSIKDRLCIVSHCVRQNDTIIRIISARKALRDEIRDFKAFQEGTGYER